MPPRQFVGAKAYRRSFENLLHRAFPGPVAEFAIGDLAITTEGTLGVSHRIDHLTLTDKSGALHRYVTRVTDVYRKTGGKCG